MADRFTQEQSKLAEEAFEANLQWFRKDLATKLKLDPQELNIVRLQISEDFILPAVEIKNGFYLASRNQDFMTAYSCPVCGSFRTQRLYHFLDNTAITLLEAKKEPHYGCLDQNRTDKIDKALELLREILVNNDPTF